jgi:hypothetical protein
MCGELGCCDPVLHTHPKQPGQQRAGEHHPDSVTLVLSPAELPAFQLPPRLWLQYRALGLLPVLVAVLLLEVLLLLFTRLLELLGVLLVPIMVLLAIMAVVLMPVCLLLLGVVF